MRAATGVGAAMVGCLCLAGCSSSSNTSTSGGGNGGGGSATVRGTIAGNAVATTDTIGLVGTVASTEVASGSVFYAAAFISSLPGTTCSVLQRNVSPPSTSALDVALASVTPIAPGTYAIGDTGLLAADVEYDALDATCSTTGSTSSFATSGSVTLTAVTSTTVQGSFDVVMNTGDPVSGTFTAPVCDAALSTTPPTTCSM